VAWKNMADGFQPTLAVVFMANENERTAVTELLSQKRIQIFGASTGDNFTDGEVESHTIVLLLLDIDPAYFQLAVKGADEGTIKEIAEQIGKSALRNLKTCNLCCIRRAGCDGDEIIAGIESACGKGTTIFGGLAADFGECKELMYLPTTNFRLWVTCVDP
jgi:hypothetical protein